jgi:CRP-like cAMP-binding protein
MLDTAATQLADHPFLAGLDSAHLEVVTECLTRRASWRSGETVLRRGDPADEALLLESGTVAIEIRAPGSAPRTIQTLSGGELIGWSWLFEPHLWTFDARAVADSTALALDSAALRSAIGADSDFGLVFVTRVAKAIVNRLKATRLQVLDVYNR